MSQTRYRPPAGGWDEAVDAAGRVRPGWEPLVSPGPDSELADPLRARQWLERLLADDGVTFSPTRAPTLIDDAPDPAPVGEPQPWRLDPVPVLLDAREWGGLETGLAQRAELLAAVQADLYGRRRLLAEGVLPPELVFAHHDYLRSMVGPGPQGPGLFMLGADLGRDGDGSWTVLADRTEAPAGAGYAMQNRRSTSRALPALYHHSALRRLTSFFQQMRIALVEAAPTTVEDPRVVLLGPGTHAETAFDQAALASQLGIPLVEGGDLTVADGRVWLRTVGRREPVDVIFRHVDARSTDPLELAPGSRLGPAGLAEVVRRGGVTVVNGLGSGVCENPALLPYLPRLCQRLLGEPLRLPSVETVWGGTGAGRTRLLQELDRLLIRSVSPDAGRGVLGSGLSAAEREELRGRIETRPHEFVGQRVLELSSVPALGEHGLEPCRLSMRLFAIRSQGAYRVLPGGLGRVLRADSRPRGLPERHLGGGVTKDVWVVDPAEAVGERSVAEERVFHTAGQGAVAMVPRVLDDLYWLGRYAERAEDLLRLVLATRAVVDESELGDGPDGPVPPLLAALCRLSPAPTGGGDPTPVGELRDLVLNRLRRGSVARSVAQLTHCADGVRDQLSADVWVVLGGVERALATLRLARFDSGAQLADTGERVLAGLLALSGITSENMVRDAGWQLLTCGRGVERALQLVMLLRRTCVPVRPGAVEQQLIEATLVATESVVTFRRRHGGRAQVASVLALLLADPGNPRSVAFQLDRVGRALERLPGDTPGSGSRRRLEDLAALVAGADLAECCRAGTDGTRRGLEGLLAEVQRQLSGLAGALTEQYLSQPLTPQPMQRVEPVVRGAHPAPVAGPGVEGPR